MLVYIFIAYLPKIHLWVNIGPYFRSFLTNCLFFNSSEEEAKFGARRLARSLQKLGFQVISSNEI